jgi:hypothetical protein
MADSTQLTPIVRNSFCTFMTGTPYGCGAPIWRAWKTSEENGARSGWRAVQCASVGTRLREPPLLQSEREQRARRQEWGKHHACLHWPVVRIVRTGAGMRSAFFDASEPLRGTSK